MSLHALVPHPDTLAAAIDRVEVELERDGANLSLVYRIAGDARRIVAPAAGAAPRRRDLLWQSTCCELFVRDAAGGGYREYNFAPSGDWTAYRFGGYREGQAALEARAPRIASERSADAFVLQVTLTEVLDDHERIGLACIVDDGAALSYWALAHPPGKPDFHHACAFALPVPRDRAAVSLA